MAGKQKNLYGRSIRNIRKSVDIRSGRKGHFHLVEMSAELDFTGVSLSRFQLGRIENLQRHLTDIELVAIASVLGVKPLDIINGEGALTLEEWGASY
jgi:hypothetical protein